jgi:hypothetical protein
MVGRPRWGLLSDQAASYNRTTATPPAWTNKVGDGQGVSQGVLELRLQQHAGSTLVEAIFLYLVSTSFLVGSRMQSTRGCGSQNALSHGGTPMTNTTNVIW